MSYYLLPFPQSAFLTDLQIKCDLERKVNSLFINYNLLGNLKELMIPELSATPERKKSLWKETCFEFFIAAANSAQYWEFNISPGGHWNVYRFSDYRQGMEEETVFSSLPSSIRKQKNSLTLSLDLNLSGIIREGQPINVAISAIVKSVDGRITYYALTHTGPQADFHNKESFTVEL